MFNGGTVLGFFAGPAKTHEEITMEALTSKATPAGRYVLLQKDNSGLEGEDQQLHVEEFEAFGNYDNIIAGSNAKFAAPFPNFCQEYNENNDSSCPGQLNR